jgi:uncharacterized membrane protein YhhN
MGTPYARSRTRLVRVAATIVGACYGVFLIVTALRLPSGAELTGQVTLQPAVGDFLRAIPWWQPSFVLGLAAFLIAEGMAVPIWWAYATSLLLITAGLFFGRASVPSATPSA